MFSYISSKTGRDVLSRPAFYEGTDFAAVERFAAIERFAYSERSAGVTEDRFLLTGRERRMIVDAILPLLDCCVVFDENRNGVVAEWRRKTVTAFKLL